MPTYESSVSLEASPERTWAYLTETEHVLAFLDRLGIAAGEVHPREGHRQRVEWSAGPDHGWLEVDREHLASSVTAELHLDAEREDFDVVLDQALFAIK